MKIKMTLFSKCCSPATARRIIGLFQWPNGIGNILDSISQSNFRLKQLPPYHC